MRSTLDAFSNPSLIKLNTSRVLLTSKQDQFNNQINQQSVRHARGIKPWKNGPIEDWKKFIYNHEYRHLRALKVLKIDLPDFHKQRKADPMKLTPDELRSTLKERGVVPHRKWLEKPVFVGDTSGIFDSYVPPEGL